MLKSIMDGRVYLFRTWDWAGILMILTFLCSVNLKLTECQLQLCPGQMSSELSCMAGERDSIVWNGTAFTDQCPTANESDAIRIAMDDLNNDTNTTTLRCGLFDAVNRLVNGNDSRFPGQMSIESNLSFVINNTTLSGNVNILCNVNVDLHDMPQVKINATIILYDIKPNNLSFGESSSMNFYWNVDNESECNLTFTVTITGISSSDFSPLTLPATGGGVLMACPTLIPGIYKFFVNSTSGSVMARSSPYPFNVSNIPQPIIDVKISNESETCNSTTITFSTSTQCEKYTIVAVLKDASCQEDQEEKTNSSVSGTGTIDLVYNFSGLEQNVTYCVCAMILDLANNTVHFCGSDLPRNGNFRTPTCSSDRVLHFQLHFMLVAAIVLWILFVL